MIDCPKGCDEKDGFGYTDHDYTDHIKITGCDSCGYKLIEQASKWWLQEAQKQGVIQILDPDGWDRANYEYSFNEEMITKEEFMIRFSKSTVSAPIEFMISGLAL